MLCVVGCLLFCWCGGVLCWRLVMPLCCRFADVLCAGVLGCGSLCVGCCFVLLLLVL